MRIRRPDASGDSAPNLTTFIDMMFILVVFFIATSRFHEAERDESIRLAKTRSTMPISTVNDVLVINIDADGQKIVDGRVRDLAELERIVRARHEEKPDGEVVIRTDTRGRVTAMAETLEICTRIGFKTPNFAFTQEE